MQLHRRKCFTRNSPKVRSSLYCKNCLKLGSGKTVVDILSRVQHEGSAIVVLIWGRGGVSVRGVELGYCVDGRGLIWGEWIQVFVWMWGLGVELCINIILTVIWSSESNKLQTNTSNWKDFLFIFYSWIHIQTLFSIWKCSLYFFCVTFSVILFQGQISKVSVTKCFLGQKCWINASCFPTQDNRDFNNGQNNRDHVLFQ